MDAQLNLPGGSRVSASATDQDASVTPLRRTHGRVDSLDGMRTLAVLAVMMVHSGFPGAELGWLGVDVFFVLSGFLITTLLCSEYQRKGRISLPKFWGRRFLRLMPAYWLYMGALTVWMLLHPSELTTYEGYSPTTYIGSLWTYWVNYLPKGGIWSRQFFTVHIWSLAVEEQFYFMWPFVFCLALRLKRPWIVGWLVVAAVLVRRTFAAPPEIGVLLSTRGIAIVLGCATAMTLALRGRPKWLASRHLRDVIAVLTVVFIALLGFFYRKGMLTDTEMHVRYIPLLAVLFVAFISMLWYGPEDRLTRFLSSRPMVYLGQISYGLYLYHIAAQVLVWDVLTPSLSSWNRYLKFGIRFSAYLSITVLAATLSYQLIERRFLLLKSKIR